MRVNFLLGLFLLFIQFVVNAQDIPYYMKKSPPIDSKLLVELSVNSRPSDVYFGYLPLFLETKIFKDQSFYFGGGIMTKNEFKFKSDSTYYIANPSYFFNLGFSNWAGDVMDGFKISFDYRMLVFKKNRFQEFASSLGYQAYYFERFLVGGDIGFGLRLPMKSNESNYLLTSFGSKFILLVRLNVGYKLF